MKQYIGIIRDHSVSMRALSNKAKDDYNSLIETIKESAKETGIITSLTVVECGAVSGEYLTGYNPFSSRTGIVKLVESNKRVENVQPLDIYKTLGGSTPLLDSVGEIISELEKLRDIDDPDVSVLIMVITDGEENSSHKWSAHSLKQKMNRLQSTDRWTFAFRCPRGGKNQLMSLGIPSGNILEWDQTEKGLEESSYQTQTAFRGYYVSRTLGTSSTDKFYVDPANLTKTDVKQNLKNITHNVIFIPVGDKVIPVRERVEQHCGHYDIGNWYYQLTKTETLQVNKDIIIRDIKTKAVYSGSQARNLLGLPSDREIKIVPANHNSNYDVFIQTKSVNRNLMPNTELVKYAR